MRKKSLIFFLSLVVTIGFAYVPAGASTINFTVNSIGTDIEAGETFSLDVLLNSENTDGSDLSIFEFDVDLSNSIFTYTGYTLGDAFNDGLTGSGISEVVSGFNFDPTAFTYTNFWLATLNFTAVSAGTETLKIKGLLTDFKGMYYDNGDINPFNDNSFDINTETSIVINEAPVPEPSTFLLFSLGLLGLARFGRKR